MTALTDFEGTISRFSVRDTPAVRGASRRADIAYEDTNGSGRLHEMNIPCFIATRAVREP